LLQFSSNIIGDHITIEFAELSFTYLRINQPILMRQISQYRDPKWFINVYISPLSFHEI
jgi:hypothetical protein